MGIGWDLDAENIKEYLDSIQNLSWDDFAFLQTIVLKRQRQHSDLHHWDLCSSTWKKSKHCLVGFFKERDEQNFETILGMQQSGLTS